MHNDGEQDGPGVVSNRTMEAVVALVLLGLSAVVIFDSNRIGFGWKEGEGPAPGYFPFYVAIILGVASLVNLYNAVWGSGKGDRESFVSAIALKRVFAVLIPTLIYVAAIGGVGPIPGLGIYVASFVFIAAFMMVVGKDSVLKSILVGAAIPLVLFMMFERWFLVPLPKGPLEAMLGFN